MIVKLTGNVTYQGAGFVVLEANGIGYKVIVPDVAAMEMRGPMTIFTHEAIREDAHDIFGFRAMDALELFWKLIAISGVGPRTAQRIVYAGSVSDVKSAIMRGELAFLTSISGIGTKTAQKIILELKGALAETPSSNPDALEAIEALEALGYSRRQAEDALAKVDAGDTEARVRMALKMLGKR